MTTVTTLAAFDHTVGNDSKLLNHMYILVIARGDGIPFHATSIQEEDIIELCVKVGQTHPIGVIWLSAMESVILY